VQPTRGSVPKFGVEVVQRTVLIVDGKVVLLVEREAAGGLEMKRRVFGNTYVAPEF
jgi:hypothetical protein